MIDYLLVLINLVSDNEVRYVLVYLLLIINAFLIFFARFIWITKLGNLHFLQLNLNNRVKLVVNAFLHFLTLRYL